MRILFKKGSGISENMHSTPLNRNVYISTRHRDVLKYPSASQFQIEAPVVLKHVHAVFVKSSKYVPETLINVHNKTFTVIADDTPANLSLASGDYEQSITSLLSAINALLTSYGVAFTVDAVTNKVVLSFTSSSVTTFSIESCKMLKLLGFSGKVELVQGSTNSMAAVNQYTTINDTDLIIRIQDIEAILSSDAVCNRATAIIASSRSKDHLLDNSGCSMFPLLQVQQRVQQLRINLLNNDGLPYDFGGADASFMIEFFCYE